MSVAPLTCCSGHVSLRWSHSLQILTLSMRLCLLLCSMRVSSCVVVDELVSTDDLQEAIEALDGVQSTDIHAFNKL